MEAVRKPERTGNREKLLAGAMQCLQEKGYARTTARDLVAASGTNLASIGYHFGSKEALLNEAIAQGMATWTATVESEMFDEDAAGLEQQAERALAATIDRFAELEPFLVAFVEAFPPAVRSDELRERMAAAYEQARGAGAEMIRRSLEADGRPVEPAQADVLSSLVLAVCDGLILQWLLDPGRVPGGRQVMDALRAVLAPA